MENDNKNNKLPVRSIVAICLDAAAALIYLLTMRLDGPPLWFFAMFVVILPVAAIINGIIALITYRTKRGIWGVVLAAAAVLIPILTVGILIILMANRVIIVTFM